MKDKLIVISSEEFFEGEAAILNRLFESGLKKFHLRKPGASKDKIETLVRQVYSNFRKYISIHYYPELVTELNLGGRHYSYADVPEMNLRNAGYTTSCSLHSWEELQTIQSKIDYCFISPVYDSISKPGYHANEVLLTVPDFAKGFPVFALGGVNLFNCKQLLRKGFQGVAVMGYLWEDKAQTVKRFIHLKDEINAYAN